MVKELQYLNVACREPFRSGWLALGFGILLAWGVFFSPSALAQEPVPPTDQEPVVPPVVTEEPPETPPAADPLLSELEQLLQQPVQVTAPALQQEVTSVSRQVSSVGKSPAAIFVITNEMIRRSGATSIPEALRMAPGLSVARIDSNKWAITARGFADRFGGKLLVQIDGRSVYTPVNSGVYWDTVDYLLQDVERIEVIRGPGATVWGANAVNGIINIITKSAHDTQGGLVQGGGGTEEKGFTSARYGGKLGENASYRVYGKWFERDGAFPSVGEPFDDWRQGRGGFRIDWNATCCDTLTLQGELFEGISGRKDTRPLLRDTGPLTVPPFRFTNLEDEQTVGGNLLTRWTHEIDEDSDWALQFYYDRFDRASTNNISLPGESLFSFQVDTLDLDFQYQFPLTCNQQVIYGLGYRRTSIFFGDSSFDDGFAIEADPAQRGLDTVTGFVQDEITLAEDLLFFTAGTKLEHNDYTGVEVQPTARLLGLPSERESVWAAVSRAVRTPSFLDDDINVGLLPSPGEPFGLPPGSQLFRRIMGDRGFISETVIAYELGYRAQPTDAFSWDSTIFYNDYDNLSSTAAGAIIPGPAPNTFVLPLNRENRIQGKTYGVEVAANLKMSETWRLYGQYTFLELQLNHDLAASQPGADAIEGQSPANQVYLQSSWDVGNNWEFDLMSRYVDHLPGHTPAIDSYIEMDARLAYRPNSCWEFAVVGQNLLDENHPEFGTSPLVFSPLVGIERGMYATATARW